MSYPEIVVGNTLDRLKDLVGMYLSMTRMARRVLECSQRVADELTAVTPERKPETTYDMTAGVPRGIGEMAGIEITVVPGMEDGAWQLREHTSCEVVDGEVSHALCRIAERGRFR